jgi:hypothetical protein
VKRIRWVAPEAIDGSSQTWTPSRLSSLVYLIGVFLKGDGSVFRSTARRELKSGQIVNYRSYALQLQVSSLSFAKFFNLKCSQVLQRSQVNIRGRDKKGMFFVTYHDQDFGGWWIGQTLHTLSPFIEAFPREYLRGRFDSEANVNNYTVTLFGAENHREVMQHDRDLCARLGMRTGDVHIYCKAGSRTYIEGRLVVTTMDKLRFGVNATDFLRVIGGLAVKERDERLKATIKGRAWTPWSTEIRAQAIDLFRRGLNPEQISVELKTANAVDVPAMTIYYWVRRGTRSWSDYKQV